MRGKRLKVTIGVITFKRPRGLQRLLESLSALQFHNTDVPSVRILIVDNDEAGVGKLSDSFISTIPWEVVYLQEPRRGIPFARNAVLDASLSSSDFVAFIDDDEVADPRWLEQLLLAQSAYSADVVAGPVVSEFESAPPKWASQGKYFERSPRETGAEVEHIGTGNVLVRSSLVTSLGIRFDPQYALSGGSDVHFFLRLAGAGAQMIWANNALAYEYVPASRVTPTWVLRRAYRTAQNYYRLDSMRYSNWRARWKNILHGLVRVFVGGVLLFPGVVLAPILGRHWIISPARIAARGLGMISGAFGGSYQEYLEVHGS